MPDIKTKYDTVKKTDLAKYGISHILLKKKYQ